MKTLVKAIAIASLASTAAVAQADVTGSLGYASSYQFRGIELAEGSIVSGSIGTDLGGLSISAVVTDATDDDFTETDYILGYTLNLGGLAVDLGYTDYNYDYGQGNDDSGEQEFSLGVTVSGLSIGYIDGEMEDSDGNEADYDVLTLGYTVSNVDITLGQVDVDGGQEWNYYEISTGTELWGLDATVMLTNTFSEDSFTDDNGVALTDDEMKQNSRIAISLSKSLSL